jgi:hypothetical protein
MILIFIVVVLSIFHLIALVTRSGHSGQCGWGLVKVRQAMCGLDVLLGLCFFLLLGDLVYLVLNNHVRVTLLGLLGLLRLLGKVV